MEYFEVNRKLFSFKGVTGRRDFLILYILVGLIINIICQTPLLYCFLNNPELIKVLNSNTPPMWASVTIIVVGLLSGLLLFPATVRRIRDILGEENDGKIFLLATTCLAIGLISLTPAGRAYSIGFLDVLIDIYLIFMKGQITGNIPHNPLLKFNWGAFWGTWIWGLRNKCYITLLMLPLLFTAGGWFLFMLLCGLMGNKWSYTKNKDKYETEENFHYDQKNQAIVLIFLAPIISIIFFAILGFASFSVVQKYVRQNPQAKTAITQQMLNLQAKATEANFDKIEIKDDEYLFYLNPLPWTRLSETSKSMFFEHAIYYVLIKNNLYLNANEDIDRYLSLSKKTKVLSNFNNEILAEFSPSEEDINEMKEYTKNNDFQSFWALRKNCIKLNSQPSTP